MEIRIRIRSTAVFAPPDFFGGGTHGPEGAGAKPEDEVELLEVLHVSGGGRVGCVGGAPACEVSIKLPQFVQCTNPSSLLSHV